MWHYTIHLTNVIISSYLVGISSVIIICLQGFCLRGMREWRVEMVERVEWKPFAPSPPPQTPIGNYVSYIACMCGINENFNLTMNCKNNINSIYCRLSVPSIVKFLCCICWNSIKYFKLLSLMLFLHFVFV